MFCEKKYRSVNKSKINTRIVTVIFDVIVIASMANHCFRYHIIIMVRKWLVIHSNKIILHSLYVKIESMTSFSGSLVLP